MTRHLVYLSAAQRDLLRITRYLAHRSGSRIVARRFVDRLRAKCQTLARLPGTLGRKRAELGPDIRSLVVSGYVIFFRYRRSEFLEIINVVEGHRDMARHVVRPNDEEE